MKLHTLPRGLVVLVAGLIITTPVFADIDPAAAKAAQKDLASAVKEAESVFKDETKVALGLLTTDVKALSKALKAELAPGDTPAKKAKELFDCLDEFMGSLNASMRNASDDVVENAAAILNGGVNGYPDGFVVGSGDGLDEAQSRLQDRAEKLVANATKRAASVQKALLKKHGYRTHIGLYLQTLPSEVPVVDADGIIEKRNWAPAVQLFVSGRSMDADDGVIHLSGIFDAAQSFSESPVSVSLTGPGASPKGGPVEPAPNGDRWSTTFLDLQSDGGDGDGVPMLKRGNYVASVAHEGFYWVTCAVGVP